MAKTQTYFGVMYRYRNDLRGREALDWKEARRLAYRELKSAGFRTGNINARTRAEAEAYASRWNARYTPGPDVGPLQVFEYSYL